MKHILFGTALAFAAAPALAAPPPPALVPDALKQPVEGYDLETPFQIWRYWVESQKGAAVDALLETPDAIEGEQAFAEPLLKFTKENDFGHYLTGEVRAYCRKGQPSLARSCHYRLRRGFVPHNAATYGEDNPLSRWTRESFDARALAGHLRASGLGPGTDWWRADRAKMFAAFPSPLPVLKEHATIVRLDSRDCPAMGAAIAALDKKRIDWRLDIATVGEDAKVEPPWPHSIRVTHSLRILVPGKASIVTIEGTGDALETLVGPILDAADECEKAREGQTSRP